ncbi:BTAD domain-containing putative transcriptional regulator [Gordonia jinhuaensis]|uniref:ATPase AAA n=1 Tax=Gordonia jinhuaensis TaxID=1517702 RepID=A0A916SY87_9ACTN|nr:AfsR/SARP family transcriptional regulator [Gordonia jinhuaensis]GGB23077.1 ATPase AAA [Gordonia jinhuaensis]
MRTYLVLGPLEVRRDSITLDLGPPKQRAVLAALLLARGSVVSVDRLVDMVWGPEPPHAAITSLQAYISNLRRVLRGDTGDPSPIERVAPGYRLVLADDHLDLIDVDELAAQVRAAAEDGRWTDVLTATEQAIGLWRGPMLPELADEKWVAVQTAGLAETRIGIIEARVAALLATADTSAALREISALRTQDRLRDRGVWLQMVALHQAGRSTEALEAYAAHVAVLDEELGIDPGTPLRELQSAILRHDPAVASWPRAPGSPVSAAIGSADTSRGTDAVRAAEGRSPAVAAHDPTGPCDPLVGRTAEREALAELFTDERRQGFRVLGLSGPPGIGKTRLAQEAVRLARCDGDTVIWVRCPDVEACPAWWPMRQLCRDLGADPDELLAIPAGADADTARFTVYERMQALLADATAGTPVTIVVDDVQWADSMSLGLLTYMTAALRDRPLCVIVTMREQTTRADLSRLRENIIRSGGRVFDLGELDRCEVHSLAGTIASLEADEVDELFARTGGNPLFVSEYARLPADRRGEAVPSAVRAVLDRRLAALDPTVREVLGVAAVIGDEIDATLLAAVTGRDLDLVADCLDEAADERIVVTPAGRQSTVFAHALLREEAMSSVRDLRRCRIHLRAARVVTQIGGHDAIARRATHLLAALPLAETADVLAACQAAAQEATGRWDSDSAAYWLQAALDTYESMPIAEQDSGERDDLLVAMLDAHTRAGRAQVVIDTVTARMSEAIALGAARSVGRLAAVLLRAGGGWPWIPPTGEVGALREVLVEASRCARGDPASAARVLAALAVCHCYHPDPAICAGHLRGARDLAASLDHTEARSDVRAEVRADVLLAELIAYSGVADHAERNIAVAQLLSTSEHSSAAVDAVIADSVATMATMTLGDIDTTERHLRRGIVGSEQMRLPILRAQLRWMEAALAVWRGEFGRAADHFRTAIAVHQQTQLYVAGSGALAMMAMATQHGLFDDIVDQVLGTWGGDRMQWVRQTMAARPGDAVVAVLTAGVAVAAGVDGDQRLAAEIVDRWRGADGPMMWTSLAHAVILADIVVDLGLLERAREFIDYLEPFRHCIATVGQVGCLGPVALALADLYALCADGDRARAALADARALSDRGGSEPGLLRCRLAEQRHRLAQRPSGSGDLPHHRDHLSDPWRDVELADIEVRARRIGLIAVADAAHALRG